MGSVMRAVHSTREAVIRKSCDENRRRDEDYTAAGAMDERARQAMERAKERTGEMTEKAKETAGETKDYTAKEARETAEKTKESAESAQEKAHEAKETAPEATSKLGRLKGKAMELFSGKKGDAKEQMCETAEEKLRESEEETQQRMEELRLKGRDEYEGDVAWIVSEDKDESERRGGGILGALVSLKEKRTSHPTPSDTDKSWPVDE